MSLVLITRVSRDAHVICRVPQTSPCAVYRAHNIASLSRVLPGGHTTNTGHTAHGKVAFAVALSVVLALPGAADGERFVDGEVAESGSGGLFNCYIIHY